MFCRSLNMKHRIFPLIIISLLSPISIETQTINSTQAGFASSSQYLSDAVKNEVPESCPVTKRPFNPFVPPSPYPHQTNPDGFWFGTEKLWLLLPTDGTWKGLGHYNPTDTAFRQKLLWWHEGYDWRKDSRPKLKVTVERLDSKAPPLVGGEHANAGWQGDSNHAFMVVGIDIPTLGCWKFTGHFEDTELSFVIWVAQ
jgi:hypothetical protein